MNKKYAWNIVKQDWIAILVYVPSNFAQKPEAPKNNTIRRQYKFANEMSITQ